MFEMEIENPFDENIQFICEDFKMIQLKFKNDFYGVEGDRTDREKMEIEKLDIEFDNWMEKYLAMEIKPCQGLIEFTVPKTGKYQIIQQSRSTNFDDRDMLGPAMGVTVQFKLNLKKVNIKLRIRKLCVYL